LVSSNFFPEKIILIFMTSDYPFGIFKHLSLEKIILVTAHYNRVFHLNIPGRGDTTYFRPPPVEKKPTQHKKKKKWFHPHNQQKNKKKWHSPPPK
jgi:hypothetical protein